MLLSTNMVPTKLADIFSPNSSLSQSTHIIKLPKISKHMMKMITLVGVMMCIIYIYSTGLKQTAVQMKPDSTMRIPSYGYRLVGFKKTKIQIKPELTREPPTEEHSYDPTIDDLKQTEIQINPELPRTRRSRHSYDPKIVSPDQQLAQVKSDLVSTIPMEEHSNDHGIVDLKQPITDIKPQFVRSNATDDHSFDHRFVSLNETGTQIKSDMESTGPTEQQIYDPSIGLKQTTIQIRSGQMTGKPIGHHFYDTQVVRLKQTKIPVKPELERTKTKVQQPSGRRIVGVKQTIVEAKPALLMSKLTRPPCQDPGISQSDVPYVHYPVPTNYRRRECACIPVRFYVIVTTQRSGSKWFESLLNSHINISSNGELFIDRERSANVSVIKQTLDTVYSLDLIHTAHRSSCTAAVGFKWMINQGIMEYHEEVIKYFQRRGVHVIFLFRRNLLRRMVSLLANEQSFKELNETHKAHVLTQQEADILASYRPKLDARLLVSKLKREAAEAATAMERFKSVRHMDLYYEDLVQNNTEKLTEVMDFLRVPRRKLSSRHVKIHTRPLSEMIGNWNAVRRALKGSRFKSFLSSD